MILIYGPKTTFLQLKINILSLYLCAKAQASTVQRTFQQQPAFKMTHTISVTATVNLECGILLLTRIEKNEHISYNFSSVKARIDEKCTKLKMANAQK